MLVCRQKYGTITDIKGPDPFSTFNGLIFTVLFRPDLGT